MFSKNTKYEDKLPLMSSLDIAKEAINRKYLGL